jgi:hypothetical protein
VKPDFCVVLAGLYCTEWASAVYSFHDCLLDTG